jgi:hypothetical protein
MIAMSDESWEEHFKQFLRKTGEDFRRTGEDIKTETQRLLAAAMDPAKQQRVRDGLKELTVWARKTAEDVGRMVEDAAIKAETVLHRTADKVTDGTEKGSRGERTPGSSEPSRLAGERQPAAGASPATRRRAAKKPTGGKGKAAKPAPKKGGKRTR